ncbi:hypothetical protein [Parabacteroides distasonis]|uniref:Uncharacterized protein n=1 Tax=Parabacteroides distasonis TaxID=823 RepID=A0A3L7ZWL8_PARDI|nr:hypothetical protein [Parabacteroides distasonis]NBH88879.1 hypothetical protein [Parabacteroides distasonis]RLT74703.1 hypothetical protein D7V78_03495 [Parabacteroides distasonis]
MFFNTTVLGTHGERNSYSKTSPGATLMRMKEDVIRSGQSKPGYNLQIGTEWKIHSNQPP